MKMTLVKLMNEITRISVQLVTHWVWLGADQYKYHVRESKREKGEEGNRGGKEEGREDNGGEIKCVVHAKL